MCAVFRCSIRQYSTLLCQAFRATVWALGPTSVTCSHTLCCVHMLAWVPYVVTTGLKSSTCNRTAVSTTSCTALLCVAFMNLSRKFAGIALN